MTVAAGYLLDTSVLCALAPGRQAFLPPGFAEQLERQADRLYLSAIVVSEVVQGIAKLRRSGAQARAQALDRWLDGLLGGYADRILPFDAPIARMAGELSDAALAAGRHPGFPDVAIAATARHAGLLLLTANLRHFEALGIACANPLESWPADH